jgi:hypothetical protein
MLVSIPTENIATLLKKVEKLNRKATKLNLSGLTYTKGATELREFKDENNKKYFIEFTEIDLDGAHPKYDGWKLISCIELDRVVGNIIKTVPGEVLPEEFRTVTGTCDHCHSNRVRNDVFVLQHDSGEYKVVGRSCIADFLGGQSAEQILWYASFLRSIEEGNYDNESLGRCKAYYNVKDILAMSHRSIKMFGWVSKAVALEQGKGSTASHVSANLFNLSNLHKYNPELIITVTEEDEKIADEVINYFSEKDDKGNDYIYNIKSFLSAGVCTDSGIGIVVSAVSAYQRDMEFARKANDKHVSEWIGTEGKRENFVLTFKACFSFSSYYGVTHFNHFEDASGNKVLWKASVDCDFTKDQTYTILGTVKKHGEYKGTKQTELSRCKVVA